MTMIYITNIWHLVIVYNIFDSYYTNFNPKFKINEKEKWEEIKEKQSLPYLTLTLLISSITDQFLFYFKYSC